MSTATTTGLLMLKVLTPEGSVLEGDVSEVTLPGSEGELGVLPAHAALLTKIIPGALAYRAPDGQGTIAVGRGVAEVRDDRVIVLVERAVPAEEIDAAALEVRRKQLLAERDTGASPRSGSKRSTRSSSSSMCNCASPAPAPLKPHTDHGGLTPQATRARVPVQSRSVPARRLLFAAPRRADSRPRCGRRCDRPASRESPPDGPGHRHRNATGSGAFRSRQRPRQLPGRSLSDHPRRPARCAALFAAGALSPGGRQPAVSQVRLRRDAPGSRPGQRPPGLTFTLTDLAGRPRPCCGLAGRSAQSIWRNACRNCAELSTNQPRAQETASHRVLRRTLPLVFVWSRLSRVDDRGFPSCRQLVLHEARRDSTPVKWPRCCGDTMPNGPRETKNTNLTNSCDTAAFVLYSSARR